MKDLISAHIRGIAPYEPGKPLEELQRELGQAWPKEGAIKLASNENPLGPSPRAIEAATAALRHANLYPDGGSFYLREKLASSLKVRPGQVVIGSGSNELIDLMVQTFCELDEEVLFPATSFACYKLSAEAHRRPFREVPNGPGFAYDLDALAQAVGPKTKLVFLANPNNPTGVYVGRAALERFLRALPAHVVLAIDEAYFEYGRAAVIPTRSSCSPRASAWSRCARSRRSTGWPGCGSATRSGRRSWSVICTACGCRSTSTRPARRRRAALDNRAHLERSRTNNTVELPLLEAALGKLGLTVTPSQGNFVLVDLGRPARPTFDALLARGVIVRPVGSYGLPNHLRITVGTPAENQRVLATLTEVL